MYKLPCILSILSINRFLPFTAELLITVVHDSIAIIRLYRERQIQVTTKLKEVDLGTSTEYLQRLKALENEKQRKIRVSYLTRVRVQI